MIDSFTSLSLQVRESAGRQIVRHYRDGRNYEAIWKENALQSFRPVEDCADTDIWIAPGLCDLQVNGYGGIDFQHDVEVDELLVAARALQRDGCYRTLLTLITSPWPVLLDRIARHRRMIQSHPELREAFPGWHIEGPWLSEKPGFSGAHNPEWMSDPFPGAIAELRQIVADDPVLLTLSPERSGSSETIREAVRQGMVVSFGHSNASAGEIDAALAAGGQAFTHLGNGCPQTLDRHDNILWRVVDSPKITAGIIPDGHHVSPALFRILHRLLPGRIYWTTDAMAAAGAPEGVYTVGEIKVKVGSDRVVRNPATNSFAGSALEPIEGIRRGAQMLRKSWREVWDLFSTVPAQLMKMPCELTSGSKANFCLLRED